MYPKPDHDLSPSSRTVVDLPVKMQGSSLFSILALGVAAVAATSPFSNHGRKSFIDVPQHQDGLYALRDDKRQLQLSKFFNNASSSMGFLKKSKEAWADVVQSLSSTAPSFRTLTST
jgi:hypothetical protein